MSNCLEGALVFHCCQKLYALTQDDATSRTQTANRKPNPNLPNDVAHRRDAQAMRLGCVEVFVGLRSERKGQTARHYINP